MFHDPRAFDRLARRMRAPVREAPVDLPAPADLVARIETALRARREGC